VSDASLALDRRLHEQDAKNEFDEGAADFVADDVNALSLNSKKYSSYLGTASVAAAFRVVSVLSPLAREFSSKARDNSPGEAKVPSSDGDTSKDAEMEYVNAYFAYIHPIIPMLDEVSFRANFQSGSRTDSPWLALLNVVLALGTIAALTSADDVHWTYYGRAKTHLGLDALGTGRLESLQALGLMGGYYLHYCQQPNMAFAVTGAAIRVASALGLHRHQPEIANGGNFTEHMNEYSGNQRTWWGLFCLDTWGSTTLGRPSFDWSGPSITVQPITWDGGKQVKPFYNSFVCSTNFSHSQLGQTLLPFTASLQFCKIAAEVQDRLSYCSILDFNEMRAFDAKLEDWFQSLPLPLRSPNPCPKKLLTPRAVLKWRYQNLRILLYRPILLFSAICQKSRQDLSETEIDAIEKCRTVASETIVDIASERVPDQISGWNATWFLFQASMIPLVSIFWEKDDIVNTGKWQSQLEMVLQLLNHMTIWSPVAQKCHEVLSSIFQISLQDRERERQGHNSLSHETQELEALKSTFPSEIAEQVWDSESWDRILEFGLENSNFVFDPMSII
jgi:hypothetical protein